MKLSYIIKLRNSLKEEFRHMPLFQNGSAIIVVNEKNQILLEERQIGKCGAFQVVCRNLEKHLKM